jgi:hypothetical protein
LEQRLRLAADVDVRNEGRGKAGYALTLIRSGNTLLRMHPAGLAEEGLGLLKRPAEIGQELSGQSPVGHPMIHRKSHSHSLGDGHIAVHRHGLVERASAPEDALDHALQTACLPSTRTNAIMIPARGVLPR